jgi:hypothetical protein
MLEILETAEYVTQRSRLVEINQQALVGFSRKLRADEIEVPQWNPLYHFRGSNEETVSYLLVLDSINFCFWPLPGKARWEITYQSNQLSGYYGLAAALKKALELGVPISKADYLAELTGDELAEILGGRGELPLLDKRLEILNELGHVLQSEYGGKALNLVEAAGKSALTLVRLLAAKLASFKDVAKYQGRDIFFYKRAQIFVADLYGAFNGTGRGDFEDIDRLTAFADYKLPQVLRHLGIFNYAQSLSRKVDQQMILDPGSPEEVEIRANTIWAVELIRRELERVGKELRAFEIDWILWNLGQQPEFRARPYHRTLTIFY